MVKGIGSNQVPPVIVLLIAGSADSQSRSASGDAFSDQVCVFTSPNSSSTQCVSRRSSHLASARISASTD